MGNANALSMGIAYVEGDVAIGTHSSTNFSILLNATSTNETLNARLLADCGVAPKKTNVKVTVKDLSATLVFGIHAKVNSLPSRDFDVACDGLVPGSGIDHPKAHVFSPIVVDKIAEAVIV